MKRLNDGEHAEFFVAGDPIVLGPGGLEPFDGGFDLAASEQERFRRQLPDPAAIRFLLFNRDDVDRQFGIGPYACRFSNPLRVAALVDCRFKDGLIERELLVITVTPSVGFEPNEVVAGLEIDDSQGRVRPVDADLALKITVLRANDALGLALFEQFTGVVAERAFSKSSLTFLVSPPLAFT